MENIVTDESTMGMQTSVWGPAGWVFLHCIAQNYPNEPTFEQKYNYFQFFKQVGNVLPCKYCRDSYKKFIKDPDTRLGKSALKNRDSFIEWLYNIHNKVNQKLKVTDIPTLESIKERYKSYRSKCKPTVVPQTGCTKPHAGTGKYSCKIIIRENSFGKQNGLRLISIKKSKAPGKKFTATFEKNGGRKIQIHFGDSSASDFTKHHDRERRNRYIKRHLKDLRTNNPARAGYLSMFVLWNKPSLQASIADYRRRLNTYNRTGKFPTKIN
jgi:hypothetical protein